MLSAKVQSRDLEKVLENKQLMYLFLLSPGENLYTLDPLNGKQVHMLCNFALCASTSSAFHNMGSVVGP
jgi:hypothetical protein